MGMKLSGSLNLTGSLNTSGSTNLTGSVVINQLTYPTFGFADGQYGIEVPTLGVNNVFTMQIPRTVYEYVKNDSGAFLAKGTPVHSTGTVGFNSLVIAASASAASTMPATFILAQDLADGEEGLGIAIGAIQGVDTTGLQAGQPVYVAPNGGWTQTKPTGSNLIQNLGIVTKVGNNGGGVVLGAGRSNDVPNIQQGYFWAGNSGSVATAFPTSSFALTASVNTFYGTQTISGSLNVYGDGLRVNRTTSGEPYTFFVKNDTNRGSIYGNNNIDGLRFFSGDSDLALTIGPSTSVTASGNLLLSNGNLVMGTAGTGIDFSATSNGSGTTTSELLNDYEEGTWTPSVVFVGTPGTVNYVNRTGRYTKIGRIVHAEYFMTGVSITGSVGYITITGLPFTINASVAGYQAFAPYGPDNLNFPSSSVLYQQGGTSSTIIYPQIITNAGFYSDFTNTNINSGGSFTVAASYTYTI